MNNKIIQSNNAPLNRIEVDTVNVDIIENALRNAREEMDAVLFRTAMSPGIREQGDCFPMIANKDGKMVVGQFGSFIHGFMEAYNGKLEEGDVLLTNDPYMCNGAVSHLPDWVVLVPIFKEQRHIAWSAMFGWTATQTSFPTISRTPIIRCCRAGKRWLKPLKTSRVWSMPRTPCMPVPRTASRG